MTSTIAAGSGGDAAPAQAPALPVLLMPETLEALKSSIMADLEAKLSVKEESLWMRGQVEIRKLQLEQRQVAGQVIELKERQLGLIAETQKIRGALMDITGKFEIVVKQVREVLRMFPKQQQQLLQQQQAVQGTMSDQGLSHSPAGSAASTSTSEAAREEHRLVSEKASAGPATPAKTSKECWSAEKARGQAAHSTPLRMWHSSRGPPSGETSAGGSACSVGLPLTETGSSRPSSSGLAGAAVDESFELPEEDDAAEPPACLRTPPRQQRSSAGGIGGSGGASASLASSVRAAAAATTPENRRAARSADRDLLSSSAESPLHGALAASAAAATAAEVLGGGGGPPAFSSALPLPSSWGGVLSSPGPAVLSLASVLPSSSPSSSSAAPGKSSTSMGRLPSTPLKRLNLSECLSEQGANDQPDVGVASRISTPLKQSRPLNFVTVEIVKEPDFVTLGIEVEEIDGAILRVDGIDENGLVWHHNNRQDSEATKVLLGDRIIEVNGVRRDTYGMLQECKVRQRVVFTITREQSRAVFDEASASVAVRPEIAAGGGQGATPGRRMRPEAQAFVPGAAAAAAAAAAASSTSAASPGGATGAAAAAAAAAGPPGLEPPLASQQRLAAVGGAASHFAQASQRASSAGDEEGEEEKPEEVVKRLFP